MPVNLAKSLSAKRTQFQTFFWLFHFSLLSLLCERLHLTGSRSRIQKFKSPPPRAMPERHVRNALPHSYLAERDNADNKINKQDENSDLRRSPENFHRSSLSFAISWSKMYTTFMTNTSDTISHNPRNALKAAAVFSIMLFIIFTVRLLSYCFHYTLHEFHGRSSFKIRITE